MIEEIIKLNSISINAKYSLNKNETILFLHFSGGNLNMWSGIIPQFQNEYGIIAPDFRGHGKSDKPLSGYSIDQMADDIYLLLKKLNIKQCHVIGSSLGAEVGLSLASSYPQMVLSLVCEGALCNEYGEYGLFNGLDEEIEYKKQEFMEVFSKREDKIFKTKDQYINEQKSELEKDGLWNEYFSRFFENNTEKTQDDTYKLCYLNHVRMEYISNYLSLKLEEYYRKVICPVLFLPSQEEWENDKVQNCIYKFASFLNKYEIGLIKDSIHAYVWMQLPVQAGKVAKEFISKNCK